jgi:hypothetical protein
LETGGADPPGHCRTIQERTRRFHLVEAALGLSPQAIIFRTFGACDEPSRRQGCLDSMHKPLFGPSLNPIGSWAEFQRGFDA